MIGDEVNFDCFSLDNYLLLITYKLLTYCHNYYQFGFPACVIANAALKAKTKAWTFHAKAIQNWPRGDSSTKSGIENYFTNFWRFSGLQLK